MKKILLMGCGGIGSWFCHFLAFGIRNFMLDVDVTVADGDIVEGKNLLYSNFDAMDVGKNKAEVMAGRYVFKAIPKNIESSEELSKFDLVIVMTDDGKTRKMVYDAGVDWIDLRAKGRAFAVFVKGCKGNKDMVKTLELNRERESCQDDHRLEKKKIDNGNLIVAGIGYQMLLNYLRNELTIRDYRGYI